MKDSCPDLLLLEMLHVHTAINYSSTETGGGRLGPGAGGWCQARAWSGSVQSSWEAEHGVEGCGFWNSGINAAF